MEDNNTQKIVKPLETPNQKPRFSSSNLIMASVSLLVISAGILTGYLLSRNGSNQVTLTTTAVVTDKEAGVVDEKTFPDTTEGILESGGINGEGTHHIVRGIGPSQYAYLTSTVIDLDKFVGKKVQVWGQTISGKKAGWLMDVGKVKVIE